MNKVLDGLVLMATLAVAAACLSPQQFKWSGTDGDGVAADADARLGDGGADVGGELDVSGDDGNIALDKVCVSSCEGKECGADGCGGSCGGCPVGFSCAVEGLCYWDGKLCGGAECPALDGYEVSCNPQFHCEYHDKDAIGWKKWDVWIWIPPGSFNMGSQGEGGDADETPPHTVAFAKGYFIGKYEVTVEEYEACHAANAKCTPADTTDGPMTQGTNTSANGKSDHPQNGLTWWQATAFCAWVGPGGRLPSEAEWEYSATGPVHSVYPWGNTPGPTCSNNTAVFLETGGEAGYGCGKGGTWTVGSMMAGASWSGALDMSGNVWEWCKDWYHQGYATAPADGSAWLEPPGSFRIGRGGSFNGGPVSLRLAERGTGTPGLRAATWGARCVRPLLGGCVPDCAGKECGDDGCEGSCGECAAGQTCQKGMCTAGTWTDQAWGLTWEKAPPSNCSDWNTAMGYCAGLDLDGGGWHVPTIGELRSLVRGCPTSEPGGACNISDAGCLSISCESELCGPGCSPGDGPAQGCYWPDEAEGPCYKYWSSTPVTDNPSATWAIWFTKGSFDPDSTGNCGNVRCVRDAP